MAPGSDQEPPIIWRTKLRSLKTGVDIAAQVAHNLDGQLVGIGWGIDELKTGASLSAVTAAIRARSEKGWGRQAAATVRRFGEDAKIGDYVWTRDLEGRFRLGRITGDYRYENNARARDLDTHQVRSAEWATRPLGDLDVPGPIIRGFSGTSTSFERTHDRGARLYTAWVWDWLQGRDPPRLEFSAAEILRQLEPYDLEDLVYTWMQVEGGYLALPKARRTDTPAYEWTMLNRNTHVPAIVQVKSGAQAVDLDALARAAPDEETSLFAYSAANAYTGSPSREVTVIATQDLLGMVGQHPKLLPPRVRRWFDLAAIGAD